MKRLLLLLLFAAAVSSAQLVVENHATGARITTPFVLPDAPVNDQEQIALDVVNTGSSTVTVGSAAVTGQYFSLCCQTGFKLAPSASVTVTLTFAPQAASYFSGSIQIDSLTIFIFARGDAAASLFLQTATGLTQAHQGTPTVLTLDSSFTGQLTCALTNNSAMPVTINNISASGDWSLPAPVALPLILQPGQQASFSLASSQGAAQTVIGGALQIGPWSYPITAHPTEPSLTMQLPSTLLASAQQVNLSIAFSTAPTQAVNGTVTLSFTPATPIDVNDPGIVFPASGSTANFTSVAGQRAANFSGQSSIVLQTGTTAGTLHLHASWDYATADTDVPIQAAPVAIESIAATRSGSTLSVTITGYDNTRTAGQMSFSFYDSQNNFIGNPIPADFTEAFYTYFFESNADDGGMFKMTAQFPVTSGTAAQVASVQVDLQNSAGDAQTSVTRF